MFIMCIVGGIFLMFLILMYVPNSIYYAVPLYVVPMLYLIWYVAGVNFNTEPVRITKNIYYFGLKLANLEIPGSEYVSYHTKNGNYYLVSDLKGFNEKKLKIPDNVELIFLYTTDLMSKFVLGFYK